MGALLINAIGKTIYRLPKDGRILVTLGEENECYQLEIQDNGFTLTKTAADLITNACELFIEDCVLQQLCQDNGIGYETSKANNGSMNTTRLMLSNSQEEIANRNAAQEFS